MNTDLSSSTQTNDRSWKHMLQKGRESLSNIEVNKDFVKTCLKMHPEDSILEVGCGTGMFLQFLYEQGYRNLIGTDLSGVAVTFGKTRYPWLDLQVQSAEKLLFSDASFLIVLSFDVLEHLRNVDRHLDEVRRVLAPGGCYMFQTPNKYSNAIYETIRNGSFTWKQYHPSLHGPRQLQQRLEKHGFDVQFIKMDVRNEFLRKKLQESPWFLRWFSKIPFHRLPLWLQTNLYVIAQKRNSDEQSGKTLNR